MKISKLYRRSSLSLSALLWVLLMLMGGVSFADDSIREIQATPTLQPFEIFEWGLSHQGERRFAIHGRLVHEVNQLRATTEAKWMYRGQLSQHIQWLKYRENRDNQAQKIRAGETLVADFIEADPPASFSALNTLYFSVHDKVKVSGDPISKSLGYTLDEQRIFQAFPPYELVGMKRRMLRESESLNTIFYGGEWIFTDQNGQEIKRPQPPLETLHSRMWNATHYHVGGGYPVRYLHDGASHEGVVKVIDRRFERIGGTWSERIEWIISGFAGVHKAKVVVNKNGLIRVIWLSDQLFAVPLRPGVFSRQSLAENERPLSLKILQKQAGTLDRETVKQMIVVAYPRMSECVTNYSSRARQRHLVIRLNLNYMGRLISAGATHQLPWTLTRCLLSSLVDLKFPKPQLLKAKVAEGLSIDHQGASLAWPLSLDHHLTRPHR